MSVIRKFLENKKTAVYKEAGEVFKTVKETEETIKKAIDVAEEGNLLKIGQAAGKSAAEGDGLAEVISLGAKFIQGEAKIGGNLLKALPVAVRLGSCLAVTIFSLLGMAIGTKEVCDGVKAGGFKNEHGKEKLKDGIADEIAGAAGLTAVIFPSVSLVALPASLAATGYRYRHEIKEYAEKAYDKVKQAVDTLSETAEKNIPLGW